MTGITRTLLVHAHGIGAGPGGFPADVHPRGPVLEHRHAALDGLLSGDARVRGRSRASRSGCPSRGVPSASGRMARDKASRRTPSP